MIRFCGLTIGGERARNKHLPLKSNTSKRNQIMIINKPDYNNFNTSTTKFHIVNLFRPWTNFTTQRKHTDITWKSPKWQIWTYKMQFQEGYKHHTRLVDGGLIYTPENGSREWRTYNSFLLLFLHACKIEDFWITRRNKNKVLSNLLAVRSKKVRWRRIFKEENIERLCVWLYWFVGVNVTQKNHSPMVKKLFSLVSSLGPFPPNKYTILGPFA